MGAFLIALTLYTATANRGVQLQDSGWQQGRIIAGEIDRPLGLALCTLFAGIGLANVFGWRSNVSRRVVIGKAALSAPLTRVVYLGPAPLCDYEACWHRW
jgi:hypothetical protein